MKKLLVLAAAAFLMMNATAFAEEVCYDCVAPEKGDICDTYWPCPGGEQGEQCTIVQPCEVIFKVCNCLEADKFYEGQEIGVIYTSVTPGAYFYPMPNWTPSLWVDGGRNNPFYCDEDWEVEGGNGLTIWDDVLYETDDEDDEVLGSESTATSEMYADCDIDSNDYFTIATTMRNGKKGGYVIDEDDFEQFWWAIEMPYMMFDWDTIEDYKCEYAKVKVELFLVDPLSTICPDCDIVCECLIDAVQICSDGDCAVDIDTSSFYFPYVLNQVSGWYTGIAISNLQTDVAIEDMSVTITVIDSTGAKYTGTYDDFTTQIEARLIDGADGWLAAVGLDDDVAEGACVFFVTCNFLGDGHQFNLNIDDINNRMFGAAVNPRIYTDGVLGALGMISK